MKESFAYVQSFDEEQEKERLKKIAQEDKEREKRLLLKRMEIEIERREKYHLPLTSRKDRETTQPK